MSTMFGFNQGQPQSTDPLLIANVATDNILLTPGSSNAGGSGFEIVAVNFCCGTSSTVTLRVFSDSGVLVGALVQTRTLTANDVWVYEFPYVLPFGWSLRAQASASGNVTVTVTYVSVKK